MANKLDSTSLLLAQVNQHAEVLGGLLSGVAQDEIDGTRIGRCIVSTHMLAKSVSLMELPDWQAVLDSYESLLKVYQEKSLPWDERIAQATSEIIEKEDLLVASAGDGGQSGLSGAVSAEELRALSHEMRELLEYTAEPSLGPETEDAASVPPPSEHRSRSDEPNGAASRDTHGKTGRGRGSLPIERGLEASMSELQRHTEALLEIWKHSDGITGRDQSPALLDLRAKLLIVGFHALSMERIVGSGAGSLSAPMIDTLAPLHIALQDYARAVSRGTDRRIEFTFSGENRSIDPRLLHPIHRVLQHMVGDVFLRCSEKHLRIDVSVEDNNGAFRWSLCDNGETFVADSRVDGDEYLAFYPGLRDTRKVLGELHALLWVELDGNLGTRFAFTTPVSLHESSFMVWGGGEERIAVLSNQLSAVRPVDEVEFASDSHGERVIADGRQVRLLRLGDLYTQGPVDGDKIVVIGALEKRIAFYVGGDGRLEKGVWTRNGMTTGSAMENGVVQVRDERIPLVEANGLLHKYMSIVDAISEADVSGGVDVDVSVPSHTQAKKGKDAKAPPELFSTKNEVDVLVVEQSESLRKTLDAMLSHRGFATKTVDGPEAALSFLAEGHASVIVCDFRMPSMAAKVVVDGLRRGGRKIPVLVTTSHRGENADVLVNRLGVAGHIIKPLDPDDVVSRVNAHVRRPAGQTPRRS